MARVEKFTADASVSPETLRDDAWREMLGGGVWAAIGAAVAAFAVKPPVHDALFILAAPPLLYGAGRFFHGLARWMKF